MNEPLIPIADAEAAFKAAEPQGVSPWIISRIRTTVPMVTGAALTYAEHEIARRYGWLPTVDSTTVASVAVFVVGSAYYELVRWAEKLKPSLGWFLGFPAQPQYARRTTTA